MRLEIMGIPFDNVTMDEALDAAMRLLSQPGASYGVTPNSEIVYETLHDDALREMICQADLIFLLREQTYYTSNLQRYAAFR